MRKLSFHLNISEKCLEFRDKRRVALHRRGISGSTIKINHIYFREERNYASTDNGVRNNTLEELFERMIACLQPTVC